jgi:hypothetical protein
MARSVVLPSRGAAVLLVLAWAGAAQAQAQEVLPPEANPYVKKGRPYRVEVNNGPTRTVQYIGVGLTPDVRLTVRELERVENSAAYSREVLALKRQYVRDEKLVEANRTVAQAKALAPEISYPNYFGLGGYLGSGYYFGGLPVGLGYPTYPSVYSGYRGGFLGAALSTGSFTTSSLGYSLPDDSVLKSSLSQTIAAQSTPEYAATLNRDAEHVALRAYASPTIRVALGLPSAEDGRRERNAIRAVVEDFSPTAPVTVTMKNGTVYRGTKTRAAEGWLVIDLVGGGQAQVRPAEVVSIVRTTKGGIIDLGPKD